MSYSAHFFVGLITQGPHLVPIPILAFAWALLTGPALGGPKTETKSWLYHHLMEELKPLI